MLTIPQNFAGDLSEMATTGAGIGRPLGNATPYNPMTGLARVRLARTGSDATLEPASHGRRMPSVGDERGPTVSVIPRADRADRHHSDGASATSGAAAVAGVVKS